MEITRKGLIFIIAASGILLLYETGRILNYVWSLAAISFTGFSLQEAASIGIIGSSDGPTAIYTPSRLLLTDLLYALPLAAVQISLAIFLLIKSVPALRNTST